MYSSMRTKFFAKTIVLIGFVFSPVFAAAGVIFQDGFESGDQSHTSNGFHWNVWNRYADPVVTTNKPHSGKYSLEFAYPGDGPNNPNSPDSWKEQRFSLGGRYTELWIKFDLFVPSNFRHRETRPGNNKFMYIETGASPGLFVGFEAWTGSGQGISGGGAGSDYMPVHLKYAGIDRGHDWSQYAPFVETNTDLNKWHEWIIHAKLASSAGSNDGAVEVWKNGKKVMEHLNEPIYTDGTNYFGQGYLMGWSNSGFDTTTTFYMDDVVISTSPIPPGGDTGSATVGSGSGSAVPLPPNNIQ